LEFLAFLLDYFKNVRVGDYSYIAFYKRYATASFKPLFAVSCLQKYSNLVYWIL